ncbi:hypothetical protein [Pseudoalteromonas sp.]|uniref:hypothetical protein n=1 Tax=Pseudoalteromonas sp. TaxID=53249 RepID=UPI001BCD3D6B|nr:hypothetical protein [Pseudoalteromonas sp.]
MKDLLNVQDYLFAVQDVGDWEGDEELVAETLNDLIHMAWDRLPDDLDCDSIDEIINGIWEHLRGDMAVIETDFEELVDWSIHYVDSALDEKM